MSREALVEFTEDFIKWWEEQGKFESHAGLNDKELSSVTWQACAEEKDKRIAELETALDNCHDQMADNVLKIRELTAQNKELVEALGNVRTATTDLHEDESSKQLINRIVKIRGLVDLAIAKARGE